MAKASKCDRLRAKIAAEWRKAYAKKRSNLTAAGKKRHDKLLKAMRTAGCRKRS